MSPPPRIEREYRVRFDESGPDGLLPASGVLRYVQDLAWVHSNEMGFGREWYADRRLTWLVHAIELEMLESVNHGEGVSVSTEVVGFRRVLARRRSELASGTGGVPRARATIDWVLLDLAGSPMRIPADIIDAFRAPATAFSPVRVRLPSSPPDADVRAFAVRRSELDPLAHVNNAAYLDYVDEQLAALAGDEAITRLPRRYRIEYRAPAEAGADVRGTAWHVGRHWYWRLESAGGRELARAMLELAAD